MILAHYKDRAALPLLNAVRFLRWGTGSEPARIETGVLRKILNQSEINEAQHVNAQNFRAGSVFRILGTKN